MRFLIVMRQLSCLVGGLVFVGTLFGAKSAPQEAAGFAMACTPDAAQRHPPRSVLQTLKALRPTLLQTAARILGALDP